MGNLYAMQNKVVENVEKEGEIREEVTRLQMRHKCLNETLA